MKNKNFLLRQLTLAGALAALFLSSSGVILAAPVVTGTPFTQATVTDLAGDVQIAPAGNPLAKNAAKLQDVFKAPDLLETGRKSRVQLTASDGTIARVGSNTAFSFEPNSRTIHLQQGSILFNSPKGIGGGTIETSAATATVLGTTIIVSATPDGGFKLLVLEGTATMKLPNGQTVTITAGQMTFVLPASKGGGVGPVLNFDLKQQAASSTLVNGFTLSLPSQNLIVDATNLQQQKIVTGDLTQTGQIVVGAVSPDQVVLVDSTTFDNVQNVNNPTQPSNMTPAGGLILGPTLGLPLPAANIVPAPGLVFTAAQLGLPNGVIPHNQATFTGLLADNISASGNVDLSTLDGLPEVDIYAQNTFAFTPSNVNNSPSTLTLFDGLSTALQLTLIAQNGFTFVSGAEIGLGSTPTLSFSTSFELISVLNDLTVGDESFFNQTGSLKLQSVIGNVSLNGTLLESDSVTGDSEGVSVKSKLGAVTLTDAHLFAASGANVTVTALRDVTISGSGSNSSLLETGNIDGSPAFQGVLSIASGSNVTVTNALLFSSQQNLVAGATLAVDNVTLNAGATTGNFVLAGDTVNLGNINFGGNSTVNLYSQNGTLNINGTVVAGDINFLTNVNYNGTGAASQLGNNVILGVTADNSAVQTAGAQAIALNASNGPPSNRVFTNVLFRPSDLGLPTDSESSIVLNGLLAGNLTASGNITLNNLPPLSNVDLAGESFGFTGNTIFTVPSNHSELRVLSIANFFIPPGITISPNFQSATGDFEMDSVHSIGFEQNTVSNPSGNLNFDTAAGDIIVSDSGISAATSLAEINFQVVTDSGNLAISNSTVSPNFGFIDAFADNISITNASFVIAGFDVNLNAGSVGLTVDSSTVRSNNGNLNVFSDTNATITNATLSTSTSNPSVQLNLNAAHVVTVVNSSLTGQNVNVGAGQTLSMDTVNMNSATTINMSARTINLSNINFPGTSQVFLSSQNGLLAPNPNTSAASVTGDVNFITNVTYGSGPNKVPAQNMVPTSVGGTSHSGNEPIHIGTISH